MRANKNGSGWIGMLNPLPPKMDRIVDGELQKKTYPAPPTFLLP